MINKIYFIVLAVFSVLINQYFANKGIFPIDSFLIFDAGNNILYGNHPFKDYWVITGPLLDYFQSLFFLIFGVNWFGYVFHASLLNMALTLFSFYFFLNIGLNNFYAFIYALGISILAYPSIGTPFIDHHAVIFSIMALYSLSLGVLTKKNIFWFLIPIFLIFSFFSKQIPSSYLTILFVIFICFFFMKKQNKQNLLYLTLGSLVSFFLIIIVFVINEIPFKNFLTQYIFYPLSLGEQRMGNLNIDFDNLIAQFKFIYLVSIPLIIGTYFLKQSKQKKLLHSEEFSNSLIFLISLAILIYCQLLTKNQVLIFFLIPIAAAYSHAYIEKYFNKKYIIYFILLIFIFSTAKYHIRFNVNKKFIDLAKADFNLSVEATTLDKRLHGIKWITPHYISNPSKEISLLIETKNILNGVKDRKIIVTDYQFFSSLLDNQFVSPNKWYDGLSVPNKNNKYYYEFKDFFITKLKLNDIKYIYFIGQNKHTMYFFNELIQKNECILSQRINELLVEFDINKCEKIL